MSIDLPAPIARYIEADNRADPDAVARCFAENAVVRDEGHTMEGSAAIRRWTAETKQEYGHTFEPLACAERDGKTVLTNRLTGHFPGSPIDLQFIFELDGDEITSLEIRS